MNAIQHAWLLIVVGTLLMSGGGVCVMFGMHKKAMAERLSRPYRITLPLESEYEGQNEMDDRWYRNRRATQSESEK